MGIFFVTVPLIVDVHWGHALQLYMGCVGVIVDRLVQTGCDVIKEKWESRD